MDSMKINLGNGADILDRHKPMFAPGVCNRTEITASQGEGAFITNYSGPIRAIRHVIGFNSGPLTNRQYIMYPSHMEIVTNVVVHELPGGIMSLCDLSNNAMGMTYYDLVNEVGIELGRNNEFDPITDGGVNLTIPSIKSDRLDPTITQVVGPQGSMTVRRNVEGSMVNQQYFGGYLNHQNDRNFPDPFGANWPGNQCSGDGEAIGEHGVWLGQPLVSTDPRDGGNGNLKLHETILFTGPDTSFDEAVEIVTSL